MDPQHVSVEQLLCSVNAHNRQHISADHERVNILALEAPFSKQDMARNLL